MNSQELYIFTNINSNISNFNELWLFFVLWLPFLLRCRIIIVPKNRYFSVRHPYRFSKKNRFDNLSRSELFRFLSTVFWFQLFLTSLVSELT